MKKVFYLFLALLAHAGVFAQSSPAAESDYTQGTLIVNEDWYGHQNSSVNFLSDLGEWTYRVFRKENPGREMGCTAQFGTIYADKLYLVSKQQKDPGAKVSGSRFAVCEAKTMKLIKEFEFIATKTVAGKQGQDSLVSIADGRSYLPVDEHKGYIGTSNGIFLYDSDNMTIGKQIKGTGNPNEEGYGQLYYAQIGTMLRANDYVFAVHQQSGLLVIDPQTDQVIRTIAPPAERGFGSVVRSKDGNLWISMAQNTLGDGSALGYMLKLNPYTFEVDTIDFPTDQGIEMIPNSWYAWTADGFCASTKENKIYWNGYGTGSWFTGYKIFCYDIDRKSFSLVYDISKMPGNWRLYGTGFRIHPATDELYCFLYHQFNDPNYALAKISPTGQLLNEYPMIVNYWFPALPVFTDIQPPVVSPKLPVNVKLSQEKPEYKLWLGDMATDADNMASAIVKTISEITPGTPFEAIVRNDSLIIGVNKPAAANSSATVCLQFNSNGKIVSQDISVVASQIATANETTAAPTISIYPNPATDHITIDGEHLIRAQIYSLGGAKVVDTPLASPTTSIDIHRLPAAVYLVKVTSAGNRVVVRKLIKR